MMFGKEMFIKHAIIEITMFAYYTLRIVDNGGNGFMYKQNL